MSFNVRDEAFKLVGVDLFRIKGLNAETVLRLLSEVEWIWDDFEPRSNFPVG